ncbi:hypothetical protein OIU84_013033 [Salix udensis]|uniref:Uncharacterized protein n=1 Tax=Salix udensis TaxID=889485 RepID=A0AAD6JHD5_9ROSI|nr:hypothetical protein OIU84_013033 [Salix udensis]
MHGVGTSGIPISLPYAFAPSSFGLTQNSASASPQFHQCMQLLYLSVDNLCFPLEVTVLSVSSSSDSEALPPLCHIQFTIYAFYTSSHQKLYVLANHSMTV